MSLVKEEKPPAYTAGIVEQLRHLILIAQTIIASATGKSPEGEV